MTLTIAELEEQIEQTVTIPTVPTTLLEIDQIVNNPDGSAAAAAEVVAKDPAIATKVLRLANSSIYGLKAQVCDIPHAVSILGLRVLRNMVVQATVLEEFGNSDQDVEGFDLDYLWDHSVKTGVAARALAKMSPVEFGLDEEVAYTAGLLHDIGKILLIENAAAGYRQALALSKEKGLHLFHAEHKVFGYTHAEVGAVLAKTWNLHPSLCAAIQFHHIPSKDPETWALGCLVHVANGVAHEVNDQKQLYRGQELRPEALQVLHLSEEALRAVREDAAAASLSELATG
jgi:putative nucleotidyltransferase with HDIG domain